MIWVVGKKSAEHQVIKIQGKTTIALTGMLILLALHAVLPLLGSQSPYAISKAAAQQCSRKIATLQSFIPEKKFGKKQATRFTQDEINSYLALNLKPRYNPCLKNLAVTFEENRMQAVVAIDFDRLGAKSSRIISKIIGWMFSGVHILTARGQIISGRGKGRFLLEQARFDGNMLPNYLVNEIIAAVGLRQKPPIDPTKPSKLPYEIERVELRSGMVIAYQ